MSIHTFYYIDKLIKFHKKVNVMVELFQTYFHNNFPRWDTFILRHSEPLAKAFLAAATAASTSAWKTHKIRFYKYPHIYRNVFIKSCIHLITFSNLSDCFTGRWIYRWKCFTRNRINELIVDENLQHTKIFIIQYSSHCRVYSNVR